MSVRWSEADARFAASPDGRAAIERAAARRARTAEIPWRERLRGEVGERAAAVVETIDLRARARAKFADADRMLFTRESLEQASADGPASHRARRFAALRRVADLTCGIGGDARALGRAGCRVVALDLDPVRLLFARHNLGLVLPPERFLVARADAVRPPLGSADGWYADPSRRDDPSTGSARRRTTDPEAAEPPLAALRELRPKLPCAVKAAPGLAWDALQWEGEAEAVSWRGEMREIVLWGNGLETAGVRRRATALPSGATLTDLDMPPRPPEGKPDAWLIEPDAAVIRAGLTAALAAREGWRRIDPRLAYLTGPGPSTIPLARAWRIEAHFPFRFGTLRDHLRDHRVGAAILKKRASAVDLRDLEKRLRLRGEESRTVFLTRLEDKPWVFVAHEA